MTRTKQPPPGVIAYTLDDDDRTRRARSLLWPIAVILLSLAVVLAHSPIAGGALLSITGAITGCRALIRKRRNTGVLTEA